MLDLSFPLPWMLGVGLLDPAVLLLRRGRPTTDLMNAKERSAPFNAIVKIGNPKVVEAVGGYGRWGRNG
jgi:hypothetical protein